MKRIACLVFLLMLTAVHLTVIAEEEPGTVTIPFEIVENPHTAISARIGMLFDDEVFEFVRAEVVSRDVLNSAPDQPDRQFGLLNMRGISAGIVGTITLRLKDNAPDGEYEILPVVDSVYSILRRPVELKVTGGLVKVENGQVYLLEPAATATPLPESPIQ